MIEFTSTKRPPFTLLDAVKGDALSPEAAGRILTRVMATIRAQQAVEEDRLATFARLRDAEGAELAACDACGLTFHVDCERCF